MANAGTDNVLPVDVDGGALYYERSGPRGGIPVIEAPGLTSHRVAWSETSALLADVDFAAADLRGRGQDRLQLSATRRSQRHQINALGPPRTL